MKKRKFWIRITGVILGVTSGVYLMMLAGSLLFISLSAILGRWRSTYIVPGVLGYLAGCLGIYYLWSLWFRFLRSDKDVMK